MVLAGLQVVASWSCVGCVRGLLAPNDGRGSEGKVPRWVRWNLSCASPAEISKQCTTRWMYCQVIGYPSTENTPFGNGSSLRSSLGVGNTLDGCGNSRLPPTVGLVHRPRNLSSIPFL